MQMRQWSITLHGPAGIISTVDTGESQFVIGTEIASDVFTVVGDGVKARHAWVWIGEARLQVEDLGGGTLVNGYLITERVQAEYPASVQIGEVTLVIEVKAVQPVAVSPTPSSLDVTIPQRAVTKSKASIEVTIPQRTPTRTAAGTVNYLKTQITDSQKPDAPLTGGYSLVREIARGGMGQIYFGEDPQLERQVAVKVSSISEDGEDPRFSKEAKVLAQLAHPNIVPIYNIGVDAQNRPFYSMKLIKGRTLQAVLNQIRDGDAVTVKDYPRTTLLTIFRKVCDAMMFAHSKGILHRDLKPENIMVGEYGEVLVMDWGLAKVLGEREEQSSSISRVNDTGEYGMTLEGEVMGTPQYMSPEQAMGMVAELDQRSDIYSLGGILYAILTLRPPIDGTTLDEVLTKVKNGSISSMVTKRGGKGPVAVGTPTAMGAEVPEALQAVTLKAMATDRNKRYASVEAFAGDIERYQNGFATQAEDAGALRKLTLFVRRNKGLSTAAGLMLVGAIAFTLRLGIEKNRALDALEKTRRAAAAANMSLADAADSESDAIAVKRALDAIPEDLRTPDWNYFCDRIDTATFTLKTPAGQSWVGFDDWPSKSESMVALRSDGTLFSVNVDTGTLHALWKLDPPPATMLGPIGISASGKLIALMKTNADVSQVDVCNLETGERLGGFTGSAFPNTRALSVSEELCLFPGVHAQGGGFFEVWDWRSSTRLWQQRINDRFTVPFAEFSRDKKSVFIAGDRQFQRREAFSGQVIASGVQPVMIGQWYPWSGVGGADWSRFFAPMNSERLRRLDPWKGTVDFEVSFKYGNFASGMIPPGDLFATVGRVSPVSGVLEIRSSSKGKVSRSLPFLGRVGIEHGAPKICAKPNAVGVRIPSALKIWRLENAKPNITLRTGHPRLQNTQRIASTVSADGKIFPAVTDLSQGKPNMPLVSNQSLPSGSYKVLVTPAGNHVLYYSGDTLGAYRLSDSGLEEIWALGKKLRWSVLGLFALHPVDGRIWTGRQVLELETGRELVTLKDRQGLSWSDSAVWVGSNRVAEIALQDLQASSAESDSFGNETVKIALWDAESGRLLTKANAPHAIWNCSSPDGMQLAEAGSDKRVRIRNGQTLEIEQEFRCHEAPLTGVAWHPTLPLLVTGATDGIIRVWSLVNFQKVDEFTSPPHQVPSRGQEYYKIRLEITADGTELNAYRDGEILVYRPQSFSTAK